MPIYEVKCLSCALEGTILSSVGEREASIANASCEACKGPLKQIISTAPGVVVPPHMQGTTSDLAEAKYKYYGIKDPITGEGITRHTNVSEPPGLSAARKGK